MALGLAEKKAIVNEVKMIAEQSLSALVADYRGLNVTQLTELRKKARENAVYVKVVRNTLARKAVEDTNFSCMAEAFSGPLIIAFSKEDPGAAARIFKDFSKENDQLKVKALSISGQLLDANKIDFLATLPTIDQARAILLSVMIAPIAKLIRTFNEFPSSIVRVISAVADKRKNGSS